MVGLLVGSKLVHSISLALVLLEDSMALQKGVWWSLARRITAQQARSEPFGLEGSRSLELSWKGVPSSSRSPWHRYSSFLFGVRLSGVT